MKKFLGIYTGSMSGTKMSEWNAQSESTRKERESAGMKAWMEWGQKHGSAIVDQGGPLGKTKLVGPSGISDTKNSMTGYVIVQAETHEDAAKMFENHPHFTIFPGETVEIMACPPVPKI